MTGQVKVVIRLFMLWFLTASLTACNASIELLATAGPVPAADASPIADWRVLEPGLSWRTIVPHGDELAQLNVLRIDPARFRFRAVYRAGEPLSLAGWQAQETNAIALINANFFDSQYRALGMVISDGQKHGVPYYDRGGTLLVSGDDVSIRSFRQGYVNVDDAIDQAVQGFPMLVEAGKQVFFNESTGRRTRRSVIAEDGTGRILLLTTPLLGLSLADLSAYLPESGLDIRTAFNLDGGGSTMMFVKHNKHKLQSFDAVPTILAVYHR